MIDEIEVIGFFVQKYVKAANAKDKEKMAKARNQIDLLLDTVEISLEAKPPAPQVISMSAMMPLDQTWMRWNCLTEKADEKYGDR